MNNNLPSALGESISEEVVDMLGDFIEVGIDFNIENDLFRNIPFVSAVVNTYKIGKNVLERHYIQKLCKFICSFNKGIVDEKSRNYYKSKLANNPKSRHQELEYILILIDRYIGYNKSDMLAKLYLAYLSKNIEWQAFSVYAEVIDRLLPGDYEILRSSNTFIIRENKNIEVYLRLVSLGLVVEGIHGLKFDNDGNGNVKISDFNGLSLDERMYKRTEFGKQLVEIINSTVFVMNK